jgi:hypothetical protein
MQVTEEKQSMTIGNMSVGTALATSNVGHREGLRKSPMARVEQLQFDRAGQLARRQHG